MQARVTFLISGLWENSGTQRSPITLSILILIRDLQSTLHSVFRRLRMLRFAQLLWRRQCVHKVFAEVDLAEIRLLACWLPIR